VLKSHLATYVAGGVVQGASAAYLTRLAGLSLIEYFEEQPPLGTTESRPLAWESIGAKLQALFQQNRQGSMLTTLAQQSLRRLLPQEAALATAPDGNSEPLSPLPSNA
jgi:hypothetical protein